MEFLTTEQAAAYIRQRHGRRCSEKYLRKLRCIGGGPLFYRRLGLIGYRREDCDMWAESPRVTGPFVRSSELAPMGAAA